MTREEKTAILCLYGYRAFKFVTEIRMFAYAFPFVPRGWVSATWEELSTQKIDLLYESLQR